MAWRTRALENRMEALLKSELGDDKGAEIYAHYVNARTRLVVNILPEIKSIEGNLTDHGVAHIGDVIDKIEYVLKASDFNVSSVEIYFLCMLALFHDVGNIHGRKGHFDKGKILEIYDFVIGESSYHTHEKVLIANAASAHSGKATDGSSDTLKELNQGEDGLYGKPIRLRRLAPVLRFADELCEGPQRTSDYMLLHHKYAKDSDIHHKYAQIATIWIDNNRIAVTLNISVKRTKGIFKPEQETGLRELLDYSYKRIIKLNSERCYNKYYSDLLNRFTETTVKINFLENGNLPHDIGLHEIVITDLRVPDNGEKDLVSFSPEHDIDLVIENLKKELESRKNDE